MIKSKSNTFDFWIIIIMFSFSLLLLVSIYLKWFFNVILINVSLKNEKELYAQLIFCIIMLLLFSSVLWHNVKYITIDLENNTISFKNIFTRNEKQYLFSDFDGIIKTKIDHGNTGTTYKTIGLVQDKRVVRRIDSYYYSNYEELMNGLNTLKDLRNKNFGIIKQIKMMLNYPALD